MLAGVLAALAAVAVAAYLWDNVRALARLRATAGIPEPPGGHWLLGHLPLLVSRPGQSFRFFFESSLTCGPVFRVRFMWRPVVICCAPELFGPLLRSGPQKLHKFLPPYAMFEFARPRRPNMLSSAENGTWRSARRAAVTAMTMSNLRHCFPHITAVTRRLVDSLAAAGPSAVQDMDLAAGQVTVDVIGLAGFDRDLRATCRGAGAGEPLPSVAGRSAVTLAGALAWAGLGAPPAPPAEAAAAAAAAAGAAARAPPLVGIEGRGQEVLEVIKNLTVAMQARNHPLNRWFPWRKAYQDLRRYGTWMSDLVVTLLEDMEARPPPAHTLGAQLMSCRHVETGEPLDRLQVLTELGLLWAAGFETTAHSITWTLFLVATHPEVEAAVVAELRALGLLASPGNPSPPAPKWEHLAQLKYLSAVISESMRLFPVVSSGTVRVTHAPTALGRFSLPAGQPVLVPFFAVHRSPALWDEPDAFRPERFLRPEAAAGKAPPPSPGGSDDDDGYVHVDAAPDVAEARDQQQQQQQQQQRGRRGSDAGGTGGGGSGLEIKEPSMSRRGFLPFSEGSRNCVGQSLALVELKAVLAMLLGTFHFDLAPEMGGYEGVAADARQAVTLRPQRGMLMTARHRSLPAPAAAAAER